MKPTKADIKRAHSIAKAHRCTLHIRKHPHQIWWGECDMPKRHIILHAGALSDRATFYSVLFHELGHQFCYDNYVYPAYHRILDKAHERLTKKEIRAVRLTGWKAELYCDRWAAVQLRTLDSRFKYVGYPVSDEEREEFHDEFLNRHYPL